MIHYDHFPSPVWPSASNTATTCLLISLSKINQKFLFYFTNLVASPASSKWNVSLVSSVYLNVIISGHFFFDVILVIVDSGLKFI